MTKTLSRVHLAKVAPRRVFPASWTRAAGLLRLRKQSLVKHTKRVRADWSR